MLTTLNDDTVSINAIYLTLWHIQAAMSDRSVSFTLLVEWLDSLIEWQRFGINLPGINEEHIQQIEAGYRDLNQQKSALCELWLKVHPNAKWEDVITALKRAGEYALARKMLKEILHEVRKQSLEKYSSMIRQFEARMKWKECVHVSEIKKHCHLFLNSLYSQDDGPNIANALAKKWDIIFNKKLGISLNWNEKAEKESFVKVKHTTDFPLSEERSLDVDYSSNAGYFGRQTSTDHFGKTRSDAKLTAISPSYDRAGQTTFCSGYVGADQTEFPLAVADPHHVF